MKRIIAMALNLCFLISITGCQGAKSRAGEGAVIGGIIGAAAGGIIGHNDGRHGGEGAAIGAAAGILTGALVGSQIKKPGQPGDAPPQAVQPAYNPNQMSLQQVVQLSKQGVHEAVIIDRMRMSNSKFILSADDVKYLQDNGVNPAVISAMQGL